MLTILCIYSCNTPAWLLFAGFFHRLQFEWQLGVLWPVCVDRRAGSELTWWHIYPRREAYQRCAVPPSVTPVTWRVSHGTPRITWSVRRCHPTGSSRRQRAISIAFSQWLLFYRDAIWGLIAPFVTGGGDVRVFSNGSWSIIRLESSNHVVHALRAANYSVHSVPGLDDAYHRVKSSLLHVPAIRWSAWHLTRTVCTAHSQHKECNYHLPE